MYQPVPGIKPTSSVFLGRCVTKSHWKGLSVIRVLVVLVKTRVGQIDPLCPVVKGIYYLFIKEEYSKKSMDTMGRRVHLNCCVNKFCWESFKSLSIDLFNIGHSWSRTQIDFI